MVLRRDTYPLEIAVSKLQYRGFSGYTERSASTEVENFYPMVSRAHDKRMDCVKCTRNPTSHFMQLYTYICIMYTRCLDGDSRCLK